MRKLREALSPDSEATASAASKAQLTEATQVLNAIKFQMRDD
jgi:hypothetical protein